MQCNSVTTFRKSNCLREDYIGQKNLQKTIRRHKRLLIIFKNNLVFNGVGEGMDISRRKGHFEARMEG